MYLHLGKSYAVSDKYILGIFDFDAVTDVGSATIEFLENAEKNGRVDVISADLPRSFIVTLDRVYISPIAATTLQQRLRRNKRFLSKGK
ncbi:MAG: DUF370 domain-containing protein [Deltaproteobacteria bacterium]|nr:DUF370 domain-containing protein [Deltaproteobacteria bacterium]